MPAGRVTAYEFGPYRVDSLSRSVLRLGEMTPLPPKAVDVLLELVKQAGSVVGKQALIERVWPETFVEEANLNQMIFLLRRAFEDGAGCEYITTVPRRGYRFTADVRMIEIPHRIEFFGDLAQLSLAASVIAHQNDVPKAVDDQLLGHLFVDEAFVGHRVQHDVAAIAAERRVVERR